jgi:D-alanyl-D-alanine carboxypeptidase
MSKRSDEEREMRTDRQSGSGFGPVQGRRALIHFSAAMLLTVVVVASACDGPGVSPGDGDRSQTLDLERALRALAPSGAVAIVRTEAGVERGAIGETESGRLADPHDRFGIASTDKTFIATVVLQLVGERRLSLEDTVGDLLRPANMLGDLRPGEFGEARRITVRQLLNHTSGVSGDRVRFPPGTKFSYAGQNYGLLKKIIKQVTGRKAWHEVIDRIVRPLNLDDTIWSPSHDEGPWLTVRASPASTVDDIATFFAALLGGKLLPPDLLSQMTQAIEGGKGFRVGLGIFELQLACGTAWGHGGEAGVFSMMPLAARDGSKVVVVAQNSGGWTAAKSVAEDMYCSSPEGSEDG